MKRDYLSRLAFLARWRFSPEEAEDIISDYCEMVANEPGTDAELVQRFGTPWDALRQIPSAGISRTWLAVFALSFVCLIVPALWVLWKPVNHMFFWLAVKKHVNVPDFLLYDELDNFFGWSPVLPMMLILGLVTPLVWFKRMGKVREPFTRGMVLTMLMLLVFLALIWLFIWVMLGDFDGFIELWAALPWTASWGVWGFIAVYFGVPAAAAGAAGAAGLLFARVRNRRWRAVYSLALLLAVLTAAFLKLFTSMNLDGWDKGWQSYHLLRYALLTVLGLVGTGVALC